MTTIYIVTSGYYSDYGISAVFDDKETAELYAGNDPESQVEEYDLNTRASRELMWWRASGYGESPVIKVDQQASMFEGLPPAPKANWSPPTGNSWNPRGLWGVEAYGRSPEHAVKIASDTLAIAKYNQEAPAFRRVT